MSEIAGEKHGYQKSDKEFWMLTIGLALGSLFIFANLYIVQPLLPLYSHEFNISPTTASLSLSLTTFSLIISLLVFGFLSDRHGRIRLMQITIWASVIPLIAIPIVNAFWWVLLWRFLCGITLAGLPAMAVAYITEEIALNSRTLSVSLYIASNALGGMVGRMIGGYLAGHFSWQFGFYGLALGGVLISSLCLYMLPPSKYFQPQQQPLLKDLHGMVIHLKNPLLMFAFIFGMMLQTAFTGIWTYVPFYLQDEPLQLTMHFISLIYLTYLFGIVGSPFAGRLAISYRINYMMGIGLTIMLVGMLITLISKTSVIIIGLSFVCLGFFTTHSLISTWVGNNATHHKSGATSFYLVSYYIGATVGSTAIGGLWSDFGWSGVIVICLIAPLITGIIFFQIIKKASTVSAVN